MSHPTIGDRLARYEANAVAPGPVEYRGYIITERADPRYPFHYQHREWNAAARDDYRCGDAASLQGAKEGINREAAMADIREAREKGNW